MNVSLKNIEEKTVINKFQAPNTQMDANMMLPLLLMKDDSDNEDLIFMMMMNQNKPAHC